MKLHGSNIDIRNETVSTFDNSRGEEKSESFEVTLSGKSLLTINTSFCKRGAGKVKIYLT